MKNIITILILSALVHVTIAQSKVDSIRLVYREKIIKALKKERVAGASIVIGHKNEILWKEGFGLADVDNELPVTPETLFGVGSVTKLFTATAIMQLHEKGLIDIDQPLGSYLEKFSINGEGYDRVTPRNVMTHHSGLPSDIFKGMFTSQPEDYKCLKNYLSEEFMAHEPNTIRAYSNPGYTLLGNAIHDVTGQEYITYVSENILEPIGMKSTGFNLIDQASKTYDKKLNVKRELPLRDVPAGAIYSSVDDLEKFIASYLNDGKDLLKATTHNTMLQAQSYPSGLDMSEKYALGWSMTSRPYTGDIFYHTGTTLYYNAALAIAPEVGLGGAILTNSENGRRIYGLIHPILNDMAKALGQTKREVDPLPELGSKELITANKEVLKKHEGIYATPGAYIKTYLRGKRLNMRLQGFRVVLLPVAEDSFIPKIMLLGFIPIRMNDTRFYFEKINGYPVLTLLEEGNTKELMAKKMDGGPIPNAWKQRCGDYEISNLSEGELDFFADFKLTEQDGILALSFKQKSTNQKMIMALDVVNEQRAKTSGLGRYAGQSVLADQNTLKVFGFELTKK